MLAEDAIKAAIRDYQLKLEKSGKPANMAGHIDVSQSVVTGETIATAHPSAK